MKTFLAFLLALLTFTASAQTVTPNESNILVASPKKIGINLNGPAYYGAAELYKNLMWRNPGFEPDLYRDKFVAYTAGTSTTFTSPDPYDLVTANFWTGATYKLYRGSPKALVCSGTIASNTVAATPNGATYTFSSACTSPVAVGDIILLRKADTCTAESAWESQHTGWWVGISGGGKITSDCTTPYDGQQSLVLDATAGGSAAKAVAHIDSGATVTGILINGQYTVAGHYKTSGAAPVFTVQAQRNVTGAGNPFSCAQQNFPASAAWTSFSMVCTGNELNTIATGDITITMAASSGIVELDDVSFQKTSGLDATNTTVFRDEVVAALKAHCAGGSLTGVPCELRDWAGQNSDEIDNTIKPAYQRMLQNNGSSYDIAGNYQDFGSLAVGLDEFLQLCKTIGAEPYYALPETTNPEEAAKWIEYLNGASGTPYGAKRVANGQVASYLSVFPSTHIAMGNENWNESISGQGLGYRVTAPDLYYDYSSDAAGVFNAMRASTSWPSGGSGVDLILGFQTGNADYGVTEAITRAQPNSAELAPYTQFNVGDVTPLAALWNPLMYEVVANTTNPAQSFYQQGSAIKRYGAKLNVYEFDNGTNSGSAGLTQAVLDNFTDTAGYGTATALQALQHLTFGIVDQNFFSLSEYATQIANGAYAHNWGAVIDMGGATNAVRPQELGMRIVNAAIIGPMYACPITSPTTYNLAANQNGQSSAGTTAANNIPQEYAYCFKNGNRRSMIAINVDIAAPHTLSFAGGGAPSGTVATTRYAPTNISDRNEAAVRYLTNLAPQPVIINAAVNINNPTSDVLAPYSVTRYDWTSTALPTTATSTTLTASPTSQTAGGNSTLTATVSNAAATGSVVFTEGATTLGTSSLTSGAATFVVAGISTGSHNYTASYSGDSSYSSSTSAAVTVTATAAAAAPPSAPYIHTVFGEVTAPHAVNGTLPATNNTNSWVDSNNDWLYFAPGLRPILTDNTHSEYANTYAHINYLDLNVGSGTGGDTGNGTYVQIYGTNFGNKSGGWDLKIGTVSLINNCARCSWTDTKIVAQIGPTAVSGNIVVTGTNYQPSNGVPFTVTPTTIVFIDTVAGSDTNTNVGTTPALAFQTWRAAFNSVTANDTAAVTQNTVLYLMPGSNVNTDDGHGFGATMSTDLAGTSATAQLNIVGMPPIAAQVLASVGNPAGPNFGIHGSSQFLTVANLTILGKTSAVDQGAGNVRFIANKTSCPSPASGQAGTGCLSFTGQGTNQPIVVQGNTNYNTGASTVNKTYNAVQFGAGADFVDMGWNNIGAGFQGYCRSIMFQTATGENLHDLHVHDNVITGGYCDGIDFASVNPSAGIVEAYNNTLSSIALSSTPFGTVDEVGIVAMTNPAPTASSNASGTVSVRNNALSDAGQSLSQNGCFGVTPSAASGATLHSVNMVLTNNTCTQTSASEPYILAGSASITGSQNLWTGAGAAPAFDAIRVTGISATPDFSSPLTMNAGYSDYVLTTSATATILARYTSPANTLRVVGYANEVDLFATIANVDTKLITLTPSFTPGNPITLSLSGNSATLSAGGQSATATIPAGVPVTNLIGFFSPIGTKAITAFDVALAAAVATVDPTQTFTVTNHFTTDGPFPVTMTSNSSGAIVYAVTSGPATISGNTVTQNGVGTVLVHANQAAAAGFNAKGIDATFSVAAPATPVVTFNIANHTTADAPFPVTAVSNSSGTIGYSITSGPATVSGNTVFLTGPGTIVVHAAQAAVTGFSSGGADATFTVATPAPGATAIAFSIPNHVSSDAPFTVTATSLSAGAFTYSVSSGPATVLGNTVTLTGSGNVTLHVVQAATAIYNAGVTNATFTVTTAVSGNVNPVLTFSVANHVSTDSAFALSAASSSPGAVTYRLISGPAAVSGGVVTFLGTPGIVVISASQAAATGFNALTVNATFAVASSAARIPGTAQKIALIVKSFTGAQTLIFNHKLSTLNPITNCYTTTAGVQITINLIAADPQNVNVTTTASAPVTCIFQFTASAP